MNTEFENQMKSILDTYNKLLNQLADIKIIQNQKLYKEIGKKKASLDELVQKINLYFKIKEEIDEANEIISEGGDEEFVEMAKGELKENEEKLENIINEIRFLMLPKDPNEGKNVIVEIRAGTGGDEAALFAADLFRMYSRYCERKRWKMEIISMSETGIGGFKEIIFYVKGENVYNYLKFESGVHRVQRVPETESQGRVHTSAVTVAVLPEIEETEINIDPKDLRIDVYRASGHGGQHVNKTESAVRITHIPTGIVVTCQDEKSQLKNKAKAMKVLRARIYELEESKKNSELANKRRELIKTGDRSEKIRTYNYPQSRVTDHRINLTLYKLPQIMDGDLEDILNALIVNEKEQLLKMNNF